MFNEYLLGLLTSDVWHSFNGVSSFIIGSGFLFMLLNYLDPNNTIMGGRHRVITLRAALFMVMAGCFMNVFDAVTYVVASGVDLSHVAPTEVILNIGLAYVVYWTCGLLRRLNSRISHAGV